MAHTFKVGDTVKLKAGGPDMSVSRVWTTSGTRPEEVVRGQWFAGKKLESGDFPPASLEAVSQEGK